MAYTRAALVSTITEGMRQRIVQKGIDPAKVVLFPPRADSSLYTLRERFDGSMLSARSMDCRESSSSLIPETWE